MFGCVALCLIGTVLGLTLSPQCGTPVLEGNAVERLVAQHIGEPPNSCGRLWCRSRHEIKPSDGQIAEIQACMARAYREKRSFFFSIEEHGVDSYVSTGLMRRGSGRLKRFWFDSNPSPTPGHPASFVVAECPAPAGPGPIDPFVDCTRGVGRSPTRR
jgi:hypothetical protein